MSNGPGIPNSHFGIRHSVFSSGVGDVFRSRSENSVGVLFTGKRLDGEAQRGRIPAAVSNRGATKPAGIFHETPAGGGSFARGRRWLSRHSPLRGCSGFAALATAKIPRRRTPRNFQTGSKRRKCCSCARFNSQGPDPRASFRILRRRWDRLLLSQPAMRTTIVEKRQLNQLGSWPLWRKPVS